MYPIRPRSNREPTSKPRIRADPPVIAWTPRSERGAAPNEVDFEISLSARTIERSATSIVGWLDSPMRLDITVDDVTAERVSFSAREDLWPDGFRSALSTVCCDEHLSSSGLGRDVPARCSCRCAQCRGRCGAVVMESVRITWQGH